jgi:hypothetical protein
VQSQAANYLVGADAFAEKNVSAALHPTIGEPAPPVESG